MSPLSWGVAPGWFVTAPSGQESAAHGPSSVVLSEESLDNCYNEMRGIRDFPRPIRSDGEPCGSLDDEADLSQPRGLHPKGPHPPGDLDIRRISGRA